LSGRKLLKLAFYVGGVVATTAGLHTVLMGSKSLPGRQRLDAVVESELRFYAAFYVAYGGLLLHIAPRADQDSTAVRGLAGALFLAGLARTGAWFAVGRPDRKQVGLLMLELGLPPIVVVAQKQLADSP
jgi:Domain of unknown function (DUF4345)